MCGVRRAVTVAIGGNDDVEPAARVEDRAAEELVGAD